MFPNAVSIREGHREGPVAEAGGYLYATVVHKVRNAWGGGGVGL